MALDTALKALLSCHQVLSWRITGDSQYPVISMRLKPASQQSVCQKVEHGETVVFRRKPPCQIQRDRRRAEEYRTRRDNGVDINTDTETTAQDKKEDAFVHIQNTETTEKPPRSENQNKTCDSVGLLHTSGDSTTNTIQRDARTETETAIRDESGGHSSSGMETDSENETETNSDSDTDTNPETKATETETESQQMIKNAASELVKEAKRLQVRPELLRQKDRNATFKKVVLDWRRSWAPALQCISDDVVVTCDAETGQRVQFYLRDPGDTRQEFWHYWQEVDRGGSHYKEMIETALNEMKEILNIVRESI